MSSIQEKYGAVMVGEGSRCLRPITGVCNHLAYVVTLPTIAISLLAILFLLPAWVLAEPGLPGAGNFGGLWNSERRLSMRIARLSNRWLPVFLIALCVFVIYSNIYSSPFVFDDIPHIVEKKNIGDLDYHLSFDGLRKPRGIVYLTFALNYRFGGLNVFGYHLVNVLIHMTNGILAYFLSLTIYRQLAPSLAQPSESQTKPTPETKRKKSKGSQIRSVKGGKHKSQNAAPSSRSAHTVASQ